MFWPMSMQTALLFEQTKDGLMIPFSDPALAGFKAKEIQYRITAWREDTVGQELFRHPIEHEVFFKASRFDRPKKTRLFMRMSLNRILDTNQFPGVFGVQFIC